jgi:DNA topoisomerase-1
LDCGGTLVRRKTRKGKFFYGCSNFPKCKFATWDEPVTRLCPVCGRPFVLKKNVFKGTPFFYCSDQNCSFKETLEESKNGQEKNKEA